ncbi:MAG TPA: hypothetical protein PKA55_00075 [Rhodoblastus sp.]|nr:hypothetical protein [Rhodoblastus sp.]
MDLPKAIGSITFSYVRTVIGIIVGFSIGRIPTGSRALRSASATAEDFSGPSALGLLSADLCAAFLVMGISPRVAVGVARFLGEIGGKDGRAVADMCQEFDLASSLAASSRAEQSGANQSNRWRGPGTDRFAASLLSTTASPGRGLF